MVAFLLFLGAAINLYVAAMQGGAIFLLMGFVCAVLFFIEVVTPRRYTR